MGTDRLDTEGLEAVAVHSQHEVVHETGVVDDQAVGRRDSMIAGAVGHAERPTLDERHVRCPTVAFGGPPVNAHPSPMTTHPTP